MKNMTDKEKNTASDINETVIALGIKIGKIKALANSVFNSEYLENVDDEQKDKKFLGSVLVDLIYELSEEYELLEKKLYI